MLIMSNLSAQARLRALIAKSQAAKEQPKAQGINQTNSSDFPSSSASLLTPRPHIAQQARANTLPAPIPKHLMPTGGISFADSKPASLTPEGKQAAQAEQAAKPAVSYNEAQLRFIDSEIGRAHV